MPEYARRPPALPDPESMTFARPVMPEQVELIAEAALHHAWVRAVRRVSNVFTYRAATRETSPGNSTGTWRTVWTTSKIAGWALVIVRYQAGLATGGPEMEMDLDLQDREDAGASLDSYTVPTDALQADDGDDEDLEPRWWISPMTFATGKPRPLALPDPGERQVELVIDGTDVRVLSVTVLELVPDDIETPRQT